MFDRIKVPFIFVPHGEEPDPAALARFSDPIRVPARFVPRNAGSDRRLQLEPFQHHVAGHGEAAEAPDEPVLGSGEADIGGPGWASSDCSGSQVDPIGAYLRVERFLARPEFTSAAGWWDNGRLEDQRIVLAQAATRGGLAEAHPGKPLAGTAIPTGYVAEDPRRWIGHSSVGTGECATLVQQATGAPLSRLWRPGLRVQGNAAIRPGTAIATFDSSGHYVGHAAIYVGQDEHGIQVIDQWNNRNREGHVAGQHAPSERTLSLNDPHHTAIDRGESYRVVE